MPNTVAILVQEVSKTYLLYRSPAQRFIDLLLGQSRRAQRFTALDKVSLHVERGETVGIVGRNGAGKSTLLAAIAGVVKPSGGRIAVNGRLGALLELGAGFHPDYTGRENVYMAASLLGLTHDEVESKFEAIASFAGIGEHIEQPVRTYSSGMFVRLAFAVHTALNPDVLIVDEALAVGDAAFQAKCFRRLRELKERGTAVLLVTHDTQSIRLFCDRAIWLDRGRVRLEGDPTTVTNEYLQYLHASELPEPLEGARASGSDKESPRLLPGAYAHEADLGMHVQNGDIVRWGRGGARLLWAGLTGEDPGAVTLRHGERLKLSVLFTCDAPPPDNLSVAFTILHRKSLELIYESTSASGLKMNAAHANGPLQADFEFDNILAPDDYSVALALWCDVDGQPEYLDFVSGVLPFKVVSNTAIHGLVRPPMVVRLGALSS